MNEIRITINAKVSADLNLSYTFVHINAGPEEAEELGKADGYFLSAYSRGYTEGADLGNKA